MDATLERSKAWTARRADVEARAGSGGGDGELRPTTHDLERGEGGETKGRVEVKWKEKGKGER